MATDTLKKTFQYKVFDSAGTYLGIWPDVSSEWNPNQDINTAGAAVQVTLARNSETTQGTLSSLTEDNGATSITTTSLDSLLMDIQAGQNIGPGTLVDVNLEVQVYCFYGYLDPLTKDDGITQITTTSLLTLDMEIGSPFGKRLFDGRITKFESFYGDNENVVVTLSPYGTDLANYVFMSGSSTSVNYTNTDVAKMVSDAVNGYGGKLTATAASIQNTNVSINYDFKLFTLQEVLDKAIEFAPETWLWWVDVGSNTVYLKPQPTLAAHTFVLGQHINNLNLTKTLETMANTVFVLGGDPGSGLIYRKYQNAASVSAYGQWLDRVKDSNILDTTSSDILGSAEVQGFDGPTYQSEIVIPAFAYDIESISLGDGIGFASFNNYIDSLVMAVMGINYTPDAVTLKLQSILTQPSKRLAQVKKDLKRESFESVPDTPTAVSV